MIARRKTTLLLVSGLFAVIGAAVYREWSLSRAPLLVCPLEIDLGVQEVGQMVTRPFPIRNAGHSELRVWGIRHSCQCTGLTEKVGEPFERVVELSVEPGTASESYLRLRVLSEKNLASEYFLVFLTNDPRKPEHQVKIRLRRAQPDLELRPAHIDLGVLEPGTRKAFRAEVYDDHQSRRQISKVTGNLPDWLAAKYEPAAEGAIDKDGKRLLGSVALEVSADQAAELFGEIVLLTDQETPANARLGVSGRVRPWLDIIPRQLVLPRRSRDEWQWTATLTFRFAGDQAGEVHLEKCPPGLQASRKGTGETVQWLVELDPKEVSRFRDGELQFTWRLGEKAGRETVMVRQNPGFTLGDAIKGD